MAKSNTAKLSPDHKVVVLPHTKHFVMFDDPAGFFRTVDAFLAAHPASR